MPKQHQRALTALVIVAASAAMGALGVWQLQRADYKRNLAQQATAVREMPPLHLDETTRNAELQRFRHVAVRLRYDGAHKFLHDNQTHHGQAGYHVLTPLRYGNRAILVNRGWVAWGEDRRRLPAIASPPDTVLAQGSLSAPPAPGLQLATDGPQSTWPRVVQTVQLAGFAHTLGYPLLPWVIQLDAQVPHGFTRAGQRVGFGAERHLGYAFQWFALAVTLPVCYLAVSLRRPRA